MMRAMDWMQIITLLANGSRKLFFRVLAVILQLVFQLITGGILALGFLKAHLKMIFMNTTLCRTYGFKKRVFRLQQVFRWAFQWVAKHMSGPEPMARFLRIFMYIHNRIFEGMITCNIHKHVMGAFILTLTTLFACKKEEVIEAPPISGPSSVCMTEKGVIYHTQFRSADRILWTVPEGATIVSGQGSDTIKVDFGRKPGRLGIVLYKNGEPVTNPEWIDVSFGVRGKWCRETDFYNEGRSGCVSFSVGNKGYIATGFSGTSQRYNDLWEYDTETNTWSQKKDLPASPRLAAIGFSIGSKGYVGCGYKGEGTTPDNFFSDFWAYDPATNLWEEKAPIPQSARQYAVGFSIGNRGYVGTGQSGLSSVPLNDFYEYNPDSNQWLQKNNVPYPCISPVAFSIGNKGYVGTGQNGQGSQNYADFYEYDPVTDVWTAKTSFPGAARFGAASFSIGSKGYISGGFSTGAVYNDFWEYDPASNSWSEMPPLQQARGFAVGFSVGSKGYLGTGNVTSSAVLEDFWVFTQ